MKFLIKDKADFIVLFERLDREYHGQIHVHCRNV